MGSDIGVGDYVECVKTLGSPEVTLGAVYLVEELTEHAGIPCLILQGVIHPRGYRKVQAACFRPIYRPKASLIEDLRVSERIGEGDEVVRANQKEVA